MGWYTNLSLAKKKPLVSGYARETYDDGLVPTDLIKLIRWYMDEVLYWQMEGRFLNKFCNKSTGQILYSSAYNYKDIEFCCYWYPNGNEKNYENQVIFGVTLSKLAKHIAELTIYYRLECKALNCVWKSIHSFNHSQSNSNCIGWNPFLMKLSKCKQVKKLDFNCYINVLRIVYSNNSAIAANEESIDSSHEVTKYEWFISQNEINEYKKCPMGKTFYSNNFGGTNNESYCLFVAPKGFNSDSNHLMLYLRLLRLPINIKTMSICYTVKVIYKEKKIKRIKESRLTKVGYCFNLCTKQCVANKIPNIMSLQSLSVHISIKIQELIDLQDKVIPKYHWEKYGVVMNHNKLFHKLLSN